MRRSLIRFARHQQGSAIVELGLVAPVLVIVLVGISQAAIALLMMHDMRGAVSSGAQYVMGGSRSTDDVRTVTMSAWVHRPAGGDVAVVQACKCGAAASACGVKCAGGSMPTTFFTVTANGTFSFALIDHPMSVAEVVRVR